VVIAIVAAVVAVEFFVFGAGSIFWGSILLGMIVVVFAETMRTR
ncbi:Mycobacterium numidiamassiliense ORFan, partial [Mycobacterium numidiamassiliense]